MVWRISGGTDKTSHQCSKTWTSSHLWSSTEKLPRLFSANPVCTVAHLSHNAHVSHMTSWRIMKDISMKSKAREHCQKLLSRDKRQRFACATGLLRYLHDGVDLSIFLDKAELDVTPVSQFHQGPNHWGCCWRCWWSWYQSETLWWRPHGAGCFCLRWMLHVSMFKNMREWHQQHFLLLWSSFSHGWTMAMTVTGWGTAASSRQSIHPHVSASQVALSQQMGHMGGALLC